MKVDIPRRKKEVFSRPFELGEFQMILSEPPMSNSSEGTHMDHASRPKFNFLKKMCKKLSYFLKQKMAVIQANQFCCNFKKTSLFAKQYEETKKLQPNFSTKFAFIKNFWCTHTCAASYYLFILISQFSSAWRFDNVICTSTLVEF